ncbi:hypothetical protein ACJMK2_027472 [Sinanodonta woodiana]|uniref:Ig-like domain-containing protein n=1 Tax=Sinanodonta woodiana TaxID=1069815 RepID=A0ABD3XN61_SINWO
MLKTVAESHHSQSLKYQGLLLILYFIVSSVNAQSVNLVKDTFLPVKGSSFGMSCILSVSFTNGISFVRNNNPLILTCSPRGCSNLDGYTFKVNQSGVYMTINSLDRGSHEGTWKCKYDGSIDSNTVNLHVYTLPTGIIFIEEPSENVDLTLTSATFQCKTIGCSYPDPVIQWIDGNWVGLNISKVLSIVCSVLTHDKVKPLQKKYCDNIKNQIMSAGTQMYTPDGCTSPEKICTSTLFFQRYSTLSDNSDKTVVFSCIADYSDASKYFRADATKSVRFAVSVTEVVLQQNNKNITDVMTVNSGEPVTFTCITGLSRPDPNIDWYIGSQKRGNGPSLNFTPSNDDHNQTIYCQAYNTDPNKIIYSLRPRLSVQVRVTEVVLQHNNMNVSDVLMVISGDPITLTCISGLSRPDPSIDWYIGSQKRGNGPSLNFTPSNDDHNQTIYCQAYNTDPNKIVYSLRPRLSVQVNVSIIILDPPGDSITFIDGTNISLSCNAGPSRPQPVIRWWLDVDEVTNLSITTVTGSGTLFTASSELHLVVNRTQHGKKVFCDARVFGQLYVIQSSKPTINVLYAPDVRVNIMSGYTVVGSTAVLECVPQGNPPQYTFHPWIHTVGQTEIRRLDGVNTVNNSTLTLSNISIQDTGNYTCTVNNSITGLNGQIDQMGNINIYVQGPPVIGVTDSTFRGETDKSAVIEIPFYSNSSIKTLKFIRDSDSFDISKTSNVSTNISSSNIKLTFYNSKVMILGHVAVIFFKNVTHRDFDNYTVQLFNDWGNVTMVFAFIASAPPSAPTTFFFSHIDAGFLVFGIEKGFNGGHEQTFIVEYRPIGITDATWSIFMISENALEDPFTNGTYYLKIPRIQAGRYIFRVYAANVIGNSSAMEGVYVTIKAEQSTAENAPVAAITGGVIGSAIFVIAIVVVALILKRRTQRPKMKAFEGKEMDSTNGKQQMNKLEKNPMYISSVPVPVEPERRFGQTEDPKTVYAQVDKSNVNKGKKAPKEKPVKTSGAAPKGKPVKASKAAPNGKTGKTSREDVYENCPVPLKSSRENVCGNPGHVAADLNSSESVYENPESSASKGHLVDKIFEFKSDL